MKKKTELDFFFRQKLKYFGGTHHARSVKFKVVHRYYPTDFQVVYTLSTIYSVFHGTTNARLFCFS